MDRHVLSPTRERNHISRLKRPKYVKKKKDRQKNVLPDSHPEHGLEEKGGILSPSAPRSFSTTREERKFSVDPVKKRSLFNDDHLRNLLQSGKGERESFLTP